VNSDMCYRDCHVGRTKCDDTISNLWSIFRLKKTGNGLQHLVHDFLPANTETNNFSTYLYQYMTPTHSTIGTLEQRPSWLLHGTKYFKSRTSGLWRRVMLW
jgi:hypothetical protein